MNVELAYGSGHLEVELPDNRTTVIVPSPKPGLADERGAVRKALAAPIGTRPLRDWVKPSSRVCITFTDITRATPNDRLIPWLLAELEGLVPGENIVLLNQLGTHRPNTRAELEKMLTPAVVANYRVVNHEPENHAACIRLGTTRGGVPAWINRHCVEADVRIITGFIEPHFFAGFSGGPKGIMPGVAHLETVMSNHGYHNMADPRATFGITDGNPLWEELRDIALRVGPSFLLNVSLNEQRQITGVFAGDLLGAHRVGCDFVKRSAMQKVDRPFEVVVSTNSGWPLDLNLYQGVKGMSAAARIVRDGGTIILAAECREGIPTGSPLDRFLKETHSPDHVLSLLAQPGFVRPEQWQAQIQALIQRRARILVHSTIPPETLGIAHLEPCPDISAAVHAELAKFGPDARVAVLPQGPLTIPYLG